MISVQDLGPVGYYSLLGLNFGCHVDQIPAAFRKAALKFHPDHQHEPSSSEDMNFELIQTARAVLSDADCKAGYDRILYLRTLLHQRDDATDELDPWLVFSISKLNSRNHRHQQHRILIFDLINKTISNYKKSKIRKTIRFEQIRDVVSITQHEIRLQVSLNSVSQFKQYIWRCRTDRTRSRLESLLVSISKDQYRFISDDRIIPQRSYLKGKVTVRKDWKGGLGSNWRDRYVMVGSTNLLIFHHDDYEEMIDCISLRDVVFGVNAGVNHAVRSRTLPLFWRHDHKGPREMLGIDPALILKFDSVTQLDQWTTLLERILTRVDSNERNLPSSVPLLPETSEIGASRPALAIEYDPEMISDPAPPIEIDESGSESDHDSDDHSQVEAAAGAGAGAGEGAGAGPDRVQSEVLRPMEHPEVLIPVRAQSEQIRRDPPLDDDSNIILRLITVRDEINNHRRRLDALLKLEKELMAERERQVMSEMRTGRDQGGFLTDLAHRIQSLFRSDRTSLM